jgi:hypothetical protein
MQVLKRPVRLLPAHGYFIAAGKDEHKDKDKKTNGDGDGDVDIDKFFYRAQNARNVCLLKVEKQCGNFTV